MEKVRGNNIDQATSIEELRREKYFSIGWKQDGDFRALWEDVTLRCDFYGLQTIKIPRNEGHRKLLEERLDLTREGIDMVRILRLKNQDISADGEEILERAILRANFESEILSNLRSWRKVEPVRFWVKRADRPRNIPDFKRYAEVWQEISRLSTSEGIEPLKKSNKIITEKLEEIGGRF